MDTKKDRGTGKKLRITKKVKSSENLDSIVFQIAKDLTKAINASGCTLSFWNKDANELYTWVEYRKAANDLGDAPGTTYSLYDYPLSLKVLETREPVTVHVTDVEADLAERKHLEQQKTSSLLMIPIILGEDVIGLVELDYNLPREFTDEDIELCQKLSNNAAYEIENANIFELIQKWLNEQNLMKLALNAITSSLKTEEVLSILCEHLCNLLDTTSAYVSTYNPENKFSTVIAENISDKASDLEKESDLGESYYEDDENFLEFIESGIPSIDSINNLQLGKFERLHMEEYGSKAVLYIPLNIKGEMKGYIEIWESRFEREFNNIEISICEAIANQAAVSIENAQLFEQARQEISERERAEQSAHHSESLMRSIAENSPDHILLLDKELKICFANFPSPGLTIDWQ